MLWGSSVLLPTLHNAIVNYERNMLRVDDKTLGLDDPAMEADDGGMPSDAMAGGTSPLMKVHNGWLWERLSSAAPDRSWPSSPKTEQKAKVPHLVELPASMQFPWRQRSGPATAQKTQNCFYAPHSEFDQGFTNALPKVEGSWALNRSTPSPYWDMSCPFEMKEFSCAHMGRKQALHAEQSRALQFVTQCHLAAFNGRRFLAALEGRHLEFVGGSTTQQHFISTACHLLPFVDWVETTDFWHRNHHDIPTACSSTGRAADENAAPDTSWPCWRWRYMAVMRDHHKRSNHTACIFLTTGTRLCYRGALTHRAMVPYLRSSWGGDVLVIATSTAHVAGGAHRKALRMMLAALKFRECLERPILLYREHVARHEQHEEPSLSKNRCQVSVADKSNQDARVMIEREEMQKENVPVLYAYESSISLGRAHVSGKDCTNFCQPGLPDFWTTLMHNAIVQRLSTLRDCGGAS